MQVTIWDLDYYFSKTKVNCFNTDVMRISSYHKQKGDRVNFVLKQDDIDRPYDLCYIIKEKNSTPNPPLRFFIADHIKWWGEAYRARINWKMSAAMLGCRPDYLIYPEKNTMQERSEYIQLFDLKGHLLPLTQDYKNSFKNKQTFVSDKYMWLADKKEICLALRRLKDVENVSFLNPIRLDIISSDEELAEGFLSLKLNRRSQLNWGAIKCNQTSQAISFIKRLQGTHPTALVGKITLELHPETHWESIKEAQKEFDECRQAIILMRRQGLHPIIQRLAHRLDTPYFFVFEELNYWTSASKSQSWVEYLLYRYPQCSIGRPETWTEPYRELLRHTWYDQEFMLVKTEDKTTSAATVPWTIFKEQFKWGI